MKIKIKYIRVTNPSPIVEGYCLYFDGVKAHEGYFADIETVIEFWHVWLVDNGYWNARHDLVNVLKGHAGEYFFNQLRQFPFPPYYVMSWSRDCDMFESTCVDKVNSYTELMKHYKGYLRGLEWAEGPSSWQLMEETEEGRWSRDRAMEAFENGRGNCLSV